MSPFVWTPDHLIWLHRSVLTWLATVDDDGQPNVSPKEIFAPWGDDQLLIAHIASPTSVRNIERHPQVCVSCLDVFAQKGLKLLGDAQVVWPNATGFPELAAPLLPLVGTRFPLKAVIQVNVRQCRPIVAPSYLLYPDTDELSQIQTAWNSYVSRLPEQAQLPAPQSCRPATGLHKESP